MAKRIKELNVNFISLVDSPANRKPIIYKSDDGLSARIDLELQIVRKDDKEGILYGVVYEPETVDTQEDWADRDTIKSAAHSFLAKGQVQMVDFQHSYEPGAGTVVESHILAGTNPNYPNVKEGAWVVAIKVADHMKEKMSSVGGLSLAGTAVYAEKSVAGGVPAARINKNSPPARVIPPAKVKLST